MPRFLHAADLHLDSPLHGLERYDGAPLEALRGATRRALNNLVTLALAQNVDFVVLAGDLYDGDWRDFNTGLFFIHQMRRLKEAGIPVFRLEGNHDAESEITRNLRLPDNVKKFGNKKPERFELEHLGIALHGQSFAKRDTTKNLAETYPRAVAGLVNIGVLHTALAGRDGHQSYAPCSVADLSSKGYDYWALGHVHNREIVSQSPWIVFPGNTQGRHIRETGDKGCTLVTVDASAGGDSPITEVQHVSLDTLRWERIQVDASGAPDEDAVCDQILRRLDPLLQTQSDKYLAIRIEIFGACPAHDTLQRHRDAFIANLRADALDLSNGRLWLEKVRIETRNQQSLDHLANTEGPLASLLKAIQTLSPEHPALSALREDIKALMAKGLTEVIDPTLVTEATYSAETLDTLRSGLLRDLLPQLLQTHSDKNFDKIIDRNRAGQHTTEII